MKKPIGRTIGTVALAALMAAALAGCATYGPGEAQSQAGDYYDQFNPAYDYYPGQAGYPYPPGYYDPYYSGQYGPRVLFGPSIHLGVGRGASGIGVGTTFGF